jgi:Mannosyltransferase (PIG-V)
MESIGKMNKKIQLWHLLANSWLSTPLLAFAVTRLGVALIAYLSMPLIIDSTIPPYHLRPENVFLDVFGSRWDTGFYVSIAQEGYKLQGVQFPSVAFFPLLPLLMRALMGLTRDPILAGLLVANLSLFGASILFYHFVLDEWGEAIARRAVWYLLIFPTSFFGSAIYTESLFLFFAIGAFYLARKGFWESTGMLGLLACLTRFIGIILAPVLFVEWLWQRQSRPAAQRPGWSALFFIAAVPVGTLAYMIYLHRTFGDPLAFVHASAAWSRMPVSPIATLYDLLHPPAEGWLSALASGNLPLDNWIDLAFVLAFLALGFTLLAQKRWSEAGFVLLGALVPASSGLLISQRRYMWVLFPAFVLLARWGERPWVDRIVTVSSLMGLGLFTALFANWYWVA